MWKPFDGSVVNIQTHFQLEEHTVSKYEHKMWKPFDGSIQFSIKWKSSIGMALVTAQFRRNALEPPSPILLARTRLNQQQTQPTCGAESGNRIRDTLVGSLRGRQMFNHCAIPAPHQ